MKKLLVITMLGLFLAGCGQPVMQSGFWDHDSMYRNWDHLKFSWSGYNQPTAQDPRQSSAEGWWGLDVPYVPGQ